MFFFTAARFHPAGRWYFSFSDRRYLVPATKFVCFFFVSLALAQFLCYPRQCRQLKFSREKNEDSTLLSFLSKCLDGHAIIAKPMGARIRISHRLTCRAEVGTDGLAPVVQTLDSAIHRINHYPADNISNMIKNGNG